MTRFGKERGMKVNLKVVAALAVVGLGTAGSVLAGENAVDFGRLNPVLQSLVDATVTGDELVEFAEPKFDESYSDLDAERLKYDLRGALRDTPWRSYFSLSASRSL